jgi:hypothetical protein
MMEVIHKKLGKGCFSVVMIPYSDGCGAVADRYSHGNELTIATQRVLICDLFAVHPKTLRLSD